MFGCGLLGVERGGLSSDMIDGLVGMFLLWLWGAVINKHTFLIAVKFWLLLSVAKNAISDRLYTRVYRSAVTLVLEKIIIILTKLLFLFVM